MLFHLFLKFWVTPENVFGMLVQLALMVGVCLIFTAWKESWWKSLVPFYGTYLIYSHTWEKWKGLFFAQILLDMLSAGCMRTVKKQIKGNLLDAAKIYLETEEIQIEMNIGLLIVCLLLFAVSTCLVFLLTRITYLKICGSLGIENVLLKIGTFLLPEVFLLVDYAVYRKKTVAAASGRS